MPRAALSEEALRASRIKRFWRSVDRRRDTECWNWLGPMNRSGYGLFGCWANSDRGKVITAHRVAYELANGPIPKGGGHHGTVIAHRCDNRRCVNPAHLFACSQAENLRDCLQKGRGNKAHGERAGKARLTAHVVSAIRTLLQDGTDRMRLARAFGVAPQTITDIATGKSWGRLPSASGGPIAIVAAPRTYNTKPNRTSFKPGSQGNPGPKPEKRTIDYAEAKLLRAKGFGIREIARRMGTTHTTVRRAVGG